MTNTWDIDVSHSAIHFHVRHMVISKVHGRFAKWAGAIQLDPQDLTRSSVEVTIDAASIDTQVADRDTHLRSADFLDVARFPEMKFGSSEVRRKSGAVFEVSGQYYVPVLQDGDKVLSETHEILAHLERKAESDRLAQG